MLCLLLVERKKKKEKKREMAGGLFSQGQTHLAGLQCRILVAVR
jgi:hypothetical protein